MNKPIQMLVILWVLVAPFLSAEEEVRVVCFGDSITKRGYPEVLAKYQKNLEEMVARSRKAGAKVVLCTLPPIEAKAYFERHEKAAFEKVGGLGGGRFIKTTLPDPSLKSALPGVDVLQVGGEGLVFLSGGESLVEVRDRFLAEGIHNSETNILR